MRPVVGLLWATLLATSSSAQPRGGILRVKLVNGSTTQAGTAEKATLFRLVRGMQPIAELGSVSGSFELKEIELAGEQPYLLQVTSGGVNYNERVSFGRGYEAEATITVYDVVSEWSDRDFEIETSRLLYRREGERLRVDEVFVIQNRSYPPKTLYNPEGTFRFHLPTEGLIEMRSVQAISSSGMPVPQQAAPLPDGSGYRTTTAFKPGSTDLAVSYDVSYANERYQLSTRTFFPLSELVIVVAPADIEVRLEDSTGWESQEEPQGRYAMLRKTNLPLGAPLELTLSGGGELAADLFGRSADDGNQPSSAPSGSPPAAGATIRIMPDPTRTEKWILVMLMGAALGFALLRSLLGPRGGELTAALARLEERRKLGSLTGKQYRAERERLENQLENQLQKAPGG